MERDVIIGTLQMTGRQPDPHRVNAGSLDPGAAE